MIDIGIAVDVDKHTLLLFALPVSAMFRKYIKIGYDRREGGRERVE